MSARGKGLVLVFFDKPSLYGNIKITEVKPCRENIRFVTDFFEIQDKTFHQKLKENGTPSPRSPGSLAAHQADVGPQFAPLYFLEEKVGVREQVSPTEKVKWLPQKG